MMRAALVFLALVGSVTVVSAASAPKAMQGVWTGTALECEAYRSDPKSMAKDAAVLRIAVDQVSGATIGTVLKVTGPASFQASGSQVAGVPMVYELRGGSILAETIGDARAASLYLRCSR